MFHIDPRKKDKITSEINALNDRGGSVRIPNSDASSSIRAFTLFQRTVMTINGPAGTTLTLEVGLIDLSYNTITRLDEWVKHSSHDYRFKQFPKIRIDNNPPGSKHWSFSLTFKKNSPVDLLELFDLVEKVEKIDNDFITFIHTALNIRISEERITKSILALADGSDFSQAIEEAKKAQKNNYYDAIWILAEYLQNKEINNPATMRGLYQSISKKSPHYPQANKQLITYITYENFPNESEFGLLEIKLALAMKSQDKCLIADIFNQLCGYKQEPVVSELTADVSGFISLARHIRQLNSQIASQTKKADNKEEKSQRYNPQMFSSKEDQPPLELSWGAYISAQK